MSIFFFSFSNFQPQNNTKHIFISYNICLIYMGAQLYILFLFLNARITIQIFKTGLQNLVVIFHVSQLEQNTNTFIAVINQQIQLGQSAAGRDLADDYWTNNTLDFFSPTVLPSNTAPLPIASTCQVPCCFFSSVSLLSALELEDPMDFTLLKNRQTSKQSQTGQLIFRIANHSLLGL